MYSRIVLSPHSVRSRDLRRMTFRACCWRWPRVFLLSGIALAADRRISDDLFVTEGPAPKRITVIVNKSRTFNVGKPFARAIVGSVDYADVLPLSDRAIYIQGKKPGTTNVSLFDGDARLIGVLDLEVTLDTGNVQEKIRGPVPVPRAFASVRSRARSC